MPRDILENIWERYRIAGKILKFPDSIMEELTTFKMRLSMDIQANVGGVARRIKASRVWHRAPLTNCVFKGGIRFRAGTTLGALESHAAEMSAKCWLNELPFGGAKGGVDVNPNHCSPQELEALTYKLVDELNERNAIGPFRDVPAPDIGTDSLIMFWVAERYSYLRRGEPYTRAVVTGKPVKIQNTYVGGIPGRVEATGYGLLIALDELQKPEYGLFKLNNHPTMAIQGFGNVGRHVAFFAEKFGYRVIAITDEFGGVFNPKGLDITKLIQYARSQSPPSVKGFPRAAPISNEELFSLSCDVLVPAAIEEVITASNAEQINAKVILEGANGPTTPQADEILNKKGVIVIPDIYANSGGVIVSFFEWAKNINLHDERIPKGNTLKAILGAEEQMLRKAGAQIIKRSQQYGVSLRLAAYILALEKGELIRARRLPEEAYQLLRE